MYKNVAKCKNFTTYLLPLRGLKKWRQYIKKKVKTFGIIA